MSGMSRVMSNLCVLRETYQGIQAIHPIHAINRLICEEWESFTV